MRNNFIKKTLKNGVKLYLYIDPKMKRTIVDYSVNYGSSGEYYDFYLDGKHCHVLPGCAHFLEHMLGEHSKYGNMYSNFSKRKYRQNAGTSDNYTHYYFIGVDDVYKSIEELINSVDDPVFTEEDVKKTSEAICEETKMTRDNKVRVAMSICSRNMFSNKELVTDTLNRIGDVNTTKKLDKKTLQLCYDAYYNDENKVLIVAGNIDEEEITKYVEEIYEKIKPHPNRRKDYDYPKDDKIRKDFQIEYMSTSDDLAVIAFKQNYNDFSKKEIEYFLDFIIESKFREDAKFIENMKKENIISRFEIFQNLFLKDNYIIYAGASTKNYEKFIENIKEELTINNFSKKDFELFKRKIIANQSFRSDYKYDFLINFVFRMGYTDDFDDIDFIKKISFDRFIEFFNSIDLKENTVALIRDSSKK